MPIALLPESNKDTDDSLSHLHDSGIDVIGEQRTCTSIQTRGSPQFQFRTQPKSQILSLHCLSIAYVSIYLCFY